MPFINIQLSCELPQHLQRELAAGAAHIMESTLGKKAELTATTITKAKQEQWYIDSTSLSENAENSAQVIARISENTNTEEEKALAIEQFYELIDSICGPINETSYVMLDEVPMTDWGYGGQTQEFRRVKRDSDGNIDINHYLEEGRRIRSESFSKLISLFRGT